MASENKLYRARIAPAGSQKSLDDLVSSNAVADLRKGLKLKHTGTGGSLPLQQDQALVASLVRRLNEVEAANDDLSQRGFQLQSENEQLQSKLNHAQASTASAAGLPAANDGLPAKGSAAAAQLTSGAGTPGATVAHLQEEAIRLRKQCTAAWAQVADMKQFLNDHGLIWVGDQASVDNAAVQGSCSAAAAAPAACAAARTELPERPQQQEGLPCNLGDLLCAVDELNRIAGDGIGHVAASKGSAARLQTPEPVPLVLFKDGLQLADHAARQYSHATALAVLTDILDGFFPSVLKREFPDGVPFTVMDRTRECMAAATHVVPGNCRTFNQLGRGGANDKDALLARLPQTIIKDGRIVDVRSSVSDFMSGSARQASQALQGNAGMQRHVLCRADSAKCRPQAGLVSSSSGSLGADAAPPAHQLEASTSCSSDVTTSAEARMTTLQIKSEDGRDTYVLKLKYTDTIATVRRCIDAHRGGVVGRSGCPRTGGGAAGSSSIACYEIRSRMPATTYYDELQSLQQAGLVPNATLFLKGC